MIVVRHWIAATVISGVLLCWAALSSPAFAADPAREAIEAANRTFLDAFVARDSAKMASIYAADAAVFPPGGERVNGRDAIAQFWAGFIKGGFKNLVLKTQEVESQGDLAFEAGEFSFDLPEKEGGKATKAAGKYVVVWKRTQGGWQIYRDIWNESPLR